MVGRLHVFRVIAMKKTDQVRQAIKDGELKKALRIAKNFRLGITKEEQVSMSRAYECMIRPDFYRQLGYDTDNVVEHGCNIVRMMFG